MTSQKYSEDFLIKHVSSGKFVHPRGGKADFKNDTDVVLHEDRHDNMVFRFEYHKNEWGYIVHKKSNKCIHPHKGDRDPNNEKKMVLHEDRHAGALFGIDNYKKHIIHMGDGFQQKKRKYMHPQGGKPNPGSDTKLVFHEDVHYAMEFIIVKPSDPTEQVDIYKDVDIDGKWVIVNLIKNPKSTHTTKVSFTVGETSTTKTTHSVTLGWEKSIEATIEMFKASKSRSVSYMAEVSNQQTFSQEVTKSHEIKGKPVFI